AMKLAQATFPHGTSRRIVVLSDFKENVGDALAEGRILADAGVGIDVVPLRSLARGDVAVEKLTLPTVLHRGEPFDLKVAVTSTNHSATAGQPVRGRLKVLRRASNQRQESIVSDEAVEVLSGKHVFTVRENVDEPDFYTYEARFTAVEQADDAIPENNVAT